MMAGQKGNIMNRWFAETFLPSIFDRCKDRGKEMWLSQKQTAICTDNMEVRQVRFDLDGYGAKGTHNNYVCDWEGRKVVLSYSKKNGCGYISFGMDKAEQEAHLAEIEAEKQRLEAEKLARIKKNPERLAKHIAFCNMKINTLREQWEAEKEEPGYDESDAEWYAEEIAKFEAKLAAYAS
jgi:hypothetical protein